MRYCVQAEETAGETVLHATPELEQRLLRFDGRAGERADAAADELLYVVEGAGAATIGGEAVTLAPGAAAFVRCGTPWRVEAATGLRVLSVLVRDPLPGAASHAVVSVEDAETGSATAGREFRLLAPCPSATQFVGFIPVGRAPDHFHAYDEVVYVLSGEGTLHVGGESAPLRPGAAVHLPARLVHCLENAGPGELQVLGVFRPAGSPAEAYYPDGTRAGS